MIQNIHKNYVKAENAEKGLLALNALKSCPVSELWNKYRLLPSNAMYLVASHFTTTLWGLTTKWEMFKRVDKVFNRLQSNPNDMQKIMISIDSAILDQKRIVSLKRLNAVLLDETKGTREKTDAYRIIGKEDGQFFEQIKYCIWVAHGKPTNAQLDFGGDMIENHPCATIQLKVIKEMIRLLKNGYSDCKKYGDSIGDLRSK